MTEAEVKAIAAEAEAEDVGKASGSSPAGDEAFGGLGAAFDEAFQNVEWQPGENN
jgi:hypothetical protein